MSGYYDQNLHWEPLAEFHFNINADEDEEICDNYIYCLCSRVQIRDIVKTYSKQEKDASDSDMEHTNDQFQEYEENSHVHFSLDATHKHKCEKDEVASCYCSASHTENYCSTDEHDPAQSHGYTNAIQPSDSGADLTYHEHFTDHQDNIKEDVTEDYLTESTWEKFWAVNGERIIWASWIKKYSDYINPTYLVANNDLAVEDVHNIPKQHSVDQIFNNEDLEGNDGSIRERKFSYDSKVNPCKKNQNINNKYENKEGLVPNHRKRSISEHDRMLSPRTILGTDSMTNVTKITFSSDMSSSHVTSNSTPTDDYSVTSSLSDEQNDQTKISNVNDNQEVPSEEMDTEQYWQFLWKKHFGEQYALHYANYIEGQNSLIEDLSSFNVESKQSKIFDDNNELSEENKESKAIEIDSENYKITEESQNSSLNEIQDKVDEINLNKDSDNRTQKTKTVKKRNKKRYNTKYLGSVGVLLQTLLKQDQSVNDSNYEQDTVINNANEMQDNKEIKNNLKQNKNNDNSNELLDAGDKESKTEKNESIDDVDSNIDMQNVSSNDQLIQINSKIPYSMDDDEDKGPPDERAVELKRSHEEDEEYQEEEESVEEKIKTTLEVMGFSVNAELLPRGRLVYRTRFARLRPPGGRRNVPRKTYFDEDGNPYQANESQEEREIQTDDSNSEQKIPLAEDPRNQESLLGTEKCIELDYDVQNKDVDVEERNVTLEAADAPLPLDMDDAQDLNDSIVDSGRTQDSLGNFETTLCDAYSMPKRKRRTKRARQDFDVTAIPEELQGDTRMLKYWKKRHSLFHRFDDGVKLDRESWFSVTPENVAWHIADKCRYDVIVDAFCGAGGNTIQFAHTCHRVIAIDIDPAKIEMAKHNAQVYGVADHIEFIVGDFFKLAGGLQADMVFLSPPWGGPDYSENQHYDIETMLEPRPASELMAVAQTISSNVAFFLPRNTKTEQLVAMAQSVGGSLEIEQSFLDRRFVAVTAYFYQES